MHIDAEPDADHSSGVLKIDRDVFQPDDDETLKGVILKLEFSASEDGAPPPYTGQIALRGLYRVHSSYKHDPKRLVRVTGASMLFGVAREMLSAITARSPNGLMTLPSVSFYEPPPQKKPPAGKSKKKQPARKSAKKKTVARPDTKTTTPRRKPAK